MPRDSFHIVQMLQNNQNGFAAEAAPRTPLGELTALPKPRKNGLGPLSGGRGGQNRKGRGRKVNKVGELAGEREDREGKARGWTLPRLANIIAGAHQNNNNHINFY